MVFVYNRHNASEIKMTRHRVHHRRDGFLHIDIHRPIQEDTIDPFERPDEVLSDVPGIDEITISHRRGNGRSTDEIQSEIDHKVQSNDHQLKPIDQDDRRQQYLGAPITLPHRNLPNGCLREIPEVDHGPHIVPPPNGSVTLVCCQSTKGLFNIAVHPTWAPNGARNFLNMVKSGFFSSRIGLFRALKNFLIQVTKARLDAVLMAGLMAGCL